MNAETLKIERKPFTVRSLRNTFIVRNTLSGALKHAGIKEKKSNCSLKGNKKSKNSKKKRLAKKKKNEFKKFFSEEYMTDGYPRSKKLLKPLKQYVVPQNRRNQVKNQTKDPPEPTQNELERKSTKTIFVSLDFIEDCQNYKKRVRKTKEASLLVPREQKQSARSLTESQEGLDKKKESEKSTIDEKSQPGTVEKGKVPVPREKTPENDTKNTTGRSALDSDDIAKIDKIYLEKLLSLAKKLDDPIYLTEGGSESETNDYPSEKKKVLRGKAYFERKMKTKELQGNFPKNAQVSSSAKRVKDVSGNHGAAAVSPRGKSEEQILLKKGKNLFETQYGNLKKKSETHSRTDINEMERRARKPRNKFMKSNFKEIVGDRSLPAEVSKVADVKELWRRNTFLRKSDNSLTSLSSCTVPEIDEYFDSKDLGSYKILKKVVEDEISNIMKKSENKDNAKDENKENDPTKPENQKPGDRNKNKDSPSPLPDGMDPEKLKALPILKRRLLQAECERKMQKAQMLSFLTDDIPKEANPQLTQLEEKTKGGKIPSKVIENWNILHRLEQAFVGLGTPTFPDKNSKISANIKPKSSITKGEITSSVEKVRADRMKEVKKGQHFKELLTKRENKGSGNKIPILQKRKAQSPAQTPKKAQSADKINTPQEKQRGVKKLEKTTKQESPQTSLANAPKREETKKKKPKIPSDPLSPKTSHNPTEPAFRNAKKEQSSPTPESPSKARLLYIRSKLQKLRKKKSEYSNLKKKSEENLERKKTFNVISVTDASIDRPHKSNSLDSVKLEDSHSQTKNQDKTPSDVVSDEVKEEQKTRSKTIESDAIARGKSCIPKRLIKTQPKVAVKVDEKTRENSKTVDEKESGKPMGKADDKIVSRLKPPGERLRNTGEKKSSNLNVTDETKVVGRKDSTNVKTADENESSNRTAVREKELSNFKTVGEKDSPNLKTKDEKESSNRTAEDLKVLDKESSNHKKDGEKESSSPKKGDEKESSKNEIIYEKESQKLAVEKDSQSPNTAGEKASPNLNTTDEKVFQSFMTGNENMPQNPKERKAYLKIITEKLPSGFKVAGEKKPLAFKVVSEKIPVSFKVACEKDFSKPKTVDEKDFSNLKIFEEMLATGFMIPSENSSNLKLIDEMVSPSPKFVCEKDSSKTVDENESPSLKTGGEKNSPKLTGGKNSSNPKNDDEKNSLKLKTVGGNESSHLNNVPETHMTGFKYAGEKHIASLKIVGEKDSNPTVDKRISAEVKDADETDSTRLEIVAEKLYSNESGESILELPKGSIIPVEDFEKEALVKELSNRALRLQQSDFKSNDSVTIKVDENNSSDPNSNTTRERAVKKRSFLSVHVNQTCDQPPRVLVQIKEKDDSDVAVGKDILPYLDQKGSDSDFSQISTLTYNLADVNVSNYFTGKCSQTPSSRGPTDHSTRLTMSLSRNSISVDESSEQEENSSDSPRKKQLWEKDLSHYRSVVRDIMNQYRRIDGFLKQTDHLIDVPNEVSSEEINVSDENSLNSQMNIDEYRKKIMTEYSERPVLEYRTKLLQSGNNLSISPRRTSLLVAKEVKRDLDVKDYPPNIHKVLDSQLYVDMESLMKRNEANYKEKNSSLQDIKIEKTEDSNQKEWLRSSSSSKAFEAWLGHTSLFDGRPLSRDQVHANNSTTANESFSDFDLS